jgi:ABC-type molybdate transport system substrate-binding protein
VRRAILAGFVAMLAVPAAAQEPVRLYAAGSLRSALTQVAELYEKQSGGKVAGTFGASGLLRERIAGGEPAEIFASANMAHPQSLAASGRAGPTVLFARNRLCALVRPGLAATTQNLLATLLDPAVRVGTSTPAADPAGDYAWALFAKAERVQDGARARLEAKALKLTGGPGAPPPPVGRSVYAANIADGNADVFLAYCTAAEEARREIPSLQIVAIPAELAVGADYGLALLRGASAQAANFAMFILSPAGQAVLKRNGFDAPGLPQEESVP